MESLPLAEVAADRPFFLDVDQAALERAAERWATMAVRAVLERDDAAMLEGLSQRPEHGR